MLRQTFQRLFLFAPKVDVWLAHTSPLFSSFTFSALYRQLFNSGRSPTNDARGIYDPVNSFYSTVKSAWDERQARPGWSSGFNANAALDASPRVVFFFFCAPLSSPAGAMDAARGPPVVSSTLQRLNERKRGGEVSLIRLGPGCAVKVIRQ